MNVLFAASLLLMPFQTATLQPRNMAPAVTVIAPENGGTPGSSEVADLTLRIFDGMLRGEVDEASLTPDTAAYLNAEALADNHRELLALGVPTRLGLEYAERVGTGTRYQYLATFPGSQLHLVVLIDREGKVADYRFQGLPVSDAPSNLLRVASPVPAPIVRVAPTPAPVHRRVPPVSHRRTPAPLHRRPSPSTPPT